MAYVIKIDKTNSLLCLYYNIIFSTHKARVENRKEELCERMLVINPSINIKRKYAVHSFVISNERERVSITKVCDMNKNFFYMFCIRMCSLFTFIVHFLLCRYLLLDIKEPTVKSSNNDA